nr:hypothetical protein [Tanacetum cinerariifolium]
PDQERLINIVKNDISDESSNDPLLEEADLFIASDNSIPSGIENFGNDSERDIRFLEELLINDFIPFPVNESPESDFDNLDIRFLEELLINDSIPFPVNESPESDFDNQSFPRPPPKPPDAEFDFEPNSEEEISVVMNDNDKFECLNPKDEFDVSNDENDDYYSFMFVIYPKAFSFLLTIESEDTIFDPGISV